MALVLCLLLLVIQYVSASKPYRPNAKELQILLHCYDALYGDDLHLFGIKYTLGDVHAKANVCVIVLFGLYGISLKIMIAYCMSMASFIL